MSCVTMRMNVTVKMMDIIGVNTQQWEICDIFSDEL